MFKASAGILFGLLSFGVLHAQPHLSNPEPAPPTAPAPAHPLRYTVWERARVDNWQWFAAPPYTSSYSYLQSLLRVGVGQRIHRWEWELELAQPAILALPNNAVAASTAQGQLGLGGSYYASSDNNSYPAAAFLKQGYLRYHFGKGKTVRVGRFEFFGGTPTHPKNPMVLWIQNNRVQQRLVGNFGFTNAQRSFDGGDANLNFGPWNVTAFAARSDQGVFNMNGNPELDVNVQLLSVTRSAAHGRVLARAFAIGYQDGRTSLTKTDNRPLAIRKMDHGKVLIGSYGGDLIAVQPAGPGSFDFMFWGAYQNGQWGELNDSGGGAAIEGGYRLTSVPSKPWMRVGWWRGSGDNNPSDGTNHTFFQVLPTPRVYARLPFYNLMNNTDEFVQVIDQPTKRLALRSDLHGLKLTQANDLWYIGGGAYDNKVFGFAGRPSNGHQSLATVADVSANVTASAHFNLGLYYGYGWGKSVVKAIYPTGSNIQFGYVQLIYHWKK